MTDVWAISEMIPKHYYYYFVGRITIDCYCNLGGITCQVFQTENSCVTTFKTPTIHAHVYAYVYSICVCMYR